MGRTQFVPLSLSLSIEGDYKAMEKAHMGLWAIGFFALSALVAPAPENESPILSVHGHDGSILRFSSEKHRERFLTGDGNTLAMAPLGSAKSTYSLRPVSVEARFSKMSAIEPARLTMNTAKTAAASMMRSAARQLGGCCWHAPCDPRDPSSKKLCKMDYRVRTRLRHSGHWRRYRLQVYPAFARLNPIQVRIPSSAFSEWSPHVKDCRQRTQCFT